MADLAPHTPSFVHRASSPRVLPIPAAKDSERTAIDLLLDQDPTFRAVLEDCAKEVKKLFPQYLKMELSLDEDIEGGLYVDVSVNQDYDDTKEAAKAFLSWIIRANRRINGRLAHVLSYP